MTFIELVKVGKASLEQIDDYVDAWHEDLFQSDIPLHEALGMTWEEYCKWALRPSELQKILNRRK